MPWTAGRHAAFTLGDKPWLPLHSDYQHVNVEVSHTWLPQHSDYQHVNVEVSHMWLPQHSDYQHVNVEVSKSHIQIIRMRITNRNNHISLAYIHYFCVTAIFRCVG